MLPNRLQCHKNTYKFHWKCCIEVWGWGLGGSFGSKTLKQTEMILSLFAACEALKAATEMRCQAQNEEAPSCTHNFQGKPCKQNDRRITKGSVTSTPQADALRSDTVTVTHIRYFTAAVNSTEDSLRSYTRNGGVLT